ncbi:MAG TPA: hypothetical protein VLS93_02850 [Anaeromyxobacteraceae bacterium]|nr:hypothetical protein [Anaeromyxobacteraceae bacterium]
MGRYRLPVVAISAAVALAGSARAAEVTRVATAADPGNPIDVDFSIRWDRFQKTGLISREWDVGGSIEDLAQLRFTQKATALVPRVAVGIYRDLELHAEIPYVLADDMRWRYALVGGIPVGGTSWDTIENNDVTPSGDPCLPAGSCPLFPVGNGTTVYHGGKAGDLLVGAAWAILSEERDDTKPKWVVGLDVTFPTAELYDPAAGRFDRPDWSSPHVNAANPGPFGQKLWRFDLSTALSRRMGPFDPYVRAHLTVQRKAAQTYSNCDNALALESPPPPTPPLPQGPSWMYENCAGFDESSAARPPYLVGLLFGAEVIPYENAAAGQKVAIDVRLSADYTSVARWYNELTDASGRIHWTEDYATVSALFGLHLKASNFVALRAEASIGTQTAHAITGESLGRLRGEDPGPPYDETNTALNPNFDWRYDSPGRRFRVSEVSLFDVRVTGILRF